MHKGFTLKEVLITLCILGMVMAIMLPMLLIKYKDKHTSAKQDSSEFSQPIKLSDVQNVEAKYWEGNLHPDNDFVPFVGVSNIYRKNILKTINISYDSRKLFISCKHSKFEYNSDSEYSRGCILYLKTDESELKAVK